MQDLFSIGKSMSPLPFYLIPKFAPDIPLSLPASHGNNICQANVAG
jgi:hypothetical protein